jgi:4-diphosphocytidyl-2-C-methyl-D-erythritol kinase
LRQQRNDLEPVACALEPSIGQVISALEAQPGCLLARMSGSGATSFGLFAEQQSAEDAARALKRHAPGWWIRKTGLCKGSPQETRATT